MVQAIYKIPQPTNVKYLCYFLVIVNDLNKYSPCFTELWNTLCKITKKNALIVWVPEHMEEFKATKHVITNAPILKNYMYWWNYSKWSLKQKTFHLADKVSLHNMAASSGLMEIVYPINFSSNMFIYIILVSINIDVKSYHLLLLHLGPNFKTYFRCYFIFTFILFVFKNFFIS